MATQQPRKAAGSAVSEKQYAAGGSQLRKESQQGILTGREISVKKIKHPPFAAKQGSCERLIKAREL